MKYKYIVLALIAASLIAVALISTVAATELTAYMGKPTKQGNEFTFTVYTQVFSQKFNGHDVDPASLVLTAYSTNGKVIVSSPNLNHVFPYDDKIVFVMESSEVPIHATAATITGSLTSGETFMATGLGWTWGNVR